MKKSKVFFVAIVVLLVSVGIWLGFKLLPPPPPPPPLPSSAMVKYYEVRIDSIRNFSNSEFCVKLFADTYSHLENCRADKNLGISIEENDRIYTRLRSDLCAAYSQKFLEQSKEIIEGDVWNKSDLSVIKDELNLLLNIDAFDAGSFVSSGVLNIQSVVLDYFQAQNFISACNSYFFPSSSINSIGIPIVVPSFFSNDYSNIVSKLGSSPLSNCPYLSSDLDMAKINLAYKHNKALEEKIDAFASLPVPYSLQTYVLSHSDWSKYIYEPLRTDLDLFESNPYNLSDNTTEVNDLNQVLANKNSSAAYYFP